MANTFFSYYGSKWYAAKHLGKPMLDLVIEPFAGSACYATYWEHPRVNLYDVDENICELWDFLIHCSADDIRIIPDRFANEEEFKALPDLQRLLTGFWVGYGRVKPANKPSPWYYKQAQKDIRTWGPSAKAMIIRQKPLIKNWTIDRLSYEQIPNQRAHWHIDPPYSGKAGRAYVYDRIDYAHLAAWCKSREGMVQVCENEGADWLPFSNPYEIYSAASSRTKSKEVIFEQNDAWYAN